MQLPFWRKRWSPKTGDRGLTDRQGRHYWIRRHPLGDGLEQIRLLFEGKQIGYANLLLDEKGGCLIGDLWIEPEHRYRGLGRMLLQEAIALAKELGACRVHGRVVQRDLDAAPQLLDWYARQGFLVELSQNEKDAASVTMVL